MPEPVVTAEPSAQAMALAREWLFRFSRGRHTGTDEVSLARMIESFARTIADAPPSSSAEGERRLANAVTCYQLEAERAEAAERKLRLILDAAKDLEMDASRLSANLHKLRGA